MFGLDPTLITFSIYIFGMILIGVLAYYYTNNLSDYILGGRKLGSFVTAMSAGASDMSGGICVWPSRRLDRHWFNSRSLF